MKRILLATAGVSVVAVFAATIGFGGLACRNPTTGIAGCCACAASGQAAAPPNSVMKSRRFTA